jgi:predicted alpha-1,2-mannosidase
MKRRVGLAFLVFFCGVTFASPAQQQREPIDYVSPNIGGIGHLLTSTLPYVQCPYGMSRVAPVTTPGFQDRYLADKIFGFPVGPAVLMASIGPVDTHQMTYASAYDHDFEIATPYYYSVNLETWNIKVDLTVSQHTAYYRFTFPASTHAHLFLSAESHAEFTVIGNNIVQGSQRISAPQANSDAAPEETREYFYAVFSRPFGSYRTWEHGSLSHASDVIGDKVGFITDSATAGGEKIEVRVGISYISTEQAKQNLMAEIPSWTFERVKSNTRDLWNKALAGIGTIGGTEQQRTIFYTALYRSLGRMTDITEGGRYFSGYDHSVHDAEGHDFYTDDGLWDTYRSLHPLQLLLDPKRQEDMVSSYLRMYEQSGSLPSFPSVAGERAMMIGHHAAPLILDLYMKGFRDFNIEEAYAAIRKEATESTMIPWSRGPLTSLDRVYFEKGFFPALGRGERETVPQVTSERRQSVSVTLEASYDDWCVAQLATALGKETDAEYFGKLAHNYANVFNSKVGFMAPKSANAKWISDFDPMLDGGQGGRDYFTEVNTWIYTFSVQHDIAGLIRLLGGRDEFNAKLDDLFAGEYGTTKYRFLGQYPDATGLVGLYSQGNEPSFHIPYLYDFSGQPWKTQRRVRQLMDVWYGDRPLGLPGDDDGGATSSWYVFSAMGFYPVCPGSPVYELGSPIFAKIVIKLGNRKTFTILANHVSAKNKYIQSAQLNGKPLNKPWFRHSDIVHGGVLILEMAGKPNTQWGISPQDVPPSMSR